MAGRSVQIDLIGRNASAIKAIDEVAIASEKAAVASSQSFEKHTSKIGSLFTTLDSSLANFGVPLTGALSAVGAKFEETGGKASTFHEKLSTLGGATILGAAAGLTLVGTEAIHLADAFEVSHARLETAVKNVGESFDEESGKISAADDKLEKLGFTNADTENSMSRLVLATHDVGKATELIGLAADVARARNIDLATATDLLVKVEAGRYTQLTRLGIATSDQVKGFKDSAQAVDFLTQKFGGQAQAYAKTFAGELQTLKVTGEDLAVGIGQHLIPVIQDSVGVLNSGVHAFEDVNAATDGWLGKLTIATAAIPAAFFAYDKLSAGLGALGSSYSRLATNVGLKTAADTEDAAASATAAASTDARVASLVELDAATQSLTASELAEVAAQGGLSANQVALAAATQANADAQLELAAASAAVAASDTVDIASLEALSAAQVEATATTTALTAAKYAEVAADDAIAGSEAAAAVGSIGTVALVAAGGLIAATGAAVGLGAALDNLFSSDDSLRIANETKAVKDLAQSLTGVGSQASEAQTKLASILGSGAAQDLQNYANAVIDGAKADDLAAISAQTHEDAQRNLAASLFGTSAAAKLSDDDLQRLVDTNGAVAGAMGLAGDKAQEFAAGVHTQDNAIKSATASLDELVSKYGGAAVQTGLLQQAQKQYADDLFLSTHQVGNASVSEQQLAKDKQKVIDASKGQASIQDKVNDATQQGTDVSKANSDALKKQQQAADQLSKDLDELGKKGTSFETLAKAMHLPDEAVKNLTSEITKIQGTTESTFDKSIDAVQNFTDKAKVSFKDFEAEEFKQLTATQNWATNLGRLADLGLNQGLLAKLDEAGPKSSALVQSILDNVKNGSISSLNAIEQSGQNSMNSLNSHLAQGVAESETHFGAFTNAANSLPQSHDFTFYDNHGDAVAGANAVSGAINSIPTYHQTDIEVRAHVPNINIGEITYDGVAVPIHQGPFAKGGDIFSDKGAALVGEEGPELFVPKGPGVIIPHPITDKLLSHKELSTEEWMFLKKHGVGGLVGGGVEKSTLPHFAAGGTIAPFGALPVTDNSISVTFHKGTTGNPVADSTNEATQALNNFISTASQQLPSAESAISDFAQHVSTDMQDVKTQTDNVNKAFRDYHQSIIDRNNAGRQVEADERDQARLIREHADAIHLKIAADRLAADQQKFDQLSQDAQRARGTVLGAQAAEAQAKAILAKQLDPANFIHHVLADTNRIKIFEVDLQKLLKEGDANLARALATAGPDQAFPLAEGFAKDKAKADAAEAALKAEATQTADYNKFLKTLGITPKALGGAFDANSLVLVGEKGPELVQFPTAGHVTPNNQLRDVGGSTTINIYATGISDRQIALQVIHALKDYVKTAGPIRGLQFAA